MMALWSRRASLAGSARGGGAVRGGGAGQAGNLYYELNRALRKRGKEDRAAMMDGWGVFMHYIMGAMAQLPKVEGVCYRGYPDKATAIAQYKLGRPIQWGAFSSTSTDFGATKGFTNQATGIIFKITVSSTDQHLFIQIDRKAIYIIPIMINGIDLTRISVLGGKNDLILSVNIKIYYSWRSDNTARCVVK